MLGFFTNLFGGGAIIPLFVGVATFATVFVVWYGLLLPRQVENRLKSVADRRDQLAKAQTRHQVVKTGHPVRDRGLEVASSMVERLKLFQGAQAKKYADELAKAGWRSRDALIIFLACRMATPLVFGLGALVVFYVMGVSDLTPALRATATLACVVLGYFAPNIYVSNQATKRRKLIQKGLPDGLDLMVICAEAGLSLDATLTRVTRELKASWAELADEINHTSLELNFMPERRTALENFSKRTALPHTRALVNTLQQSERYGTPLAHALRVLAAEIRMNRMMKAEEKAARLPAIMTVPMILFILPALFVVLIGPAILRIADQMGALTGG